MHDDAAVHRVCVAESKVHGRGLFAAMALPAGHKIPVWGAFYGEKMFRIEKANPDFHGPRWVSIQYTDPTCWLRMDDRCAAYFCNGADVDHPSNCLFMEGPVRQESPAVNRLSSSYLCIVTKRVIASGEELIVPYTHEYVSVQLTNTKLFFD